MKFHALKNPLFILAFCQTRVTKDQSFQVIPFTSCWEMPLQVKNSQWRITLATEETQVCCLLPSITMDPKLPFYSNLPFIAEPFRNPPILQAVLSTECFYLYLSALSIIMLLNKQLPIISYSMLHVS